MSLLSQAIESYKKEGLNYVAVAGLRFMLNNIERNTVKRTRLRYPYYVRRYERNAISAMTKLCNKGIGPAIYDFPLDQYKTSDTIFILGSGDSINDITSDMWQHIRNNDSMGLNRWPVHDFIPTYHIFELKMNSDYDDFRRDYWELLSLRSEDYSNTPLILKNTIYVAQELSSDMIPNKLDGRIIISADTSYPELTNNTSDPVQSNRKLLQYLAQAGRFEEESSRPIYRRRGSVSYLIHLAVKLGYSNIVLCGIDMVDSMYFFEQNYSYYNQKSYPIPKHESDDKDGEHKTNDPDYGELTLETIIHQMNDIVLEPKGIELFVENTKFALHPKVPLYSQD